MNHLSGDQIFRLLFSDSQELFMERLRGLDLAAGGCAAHYRSGRYAGWVKQLIVTMRDGASIDLMTWPAATARADPTIADALSGHFSFDAKGVAPRYPDPISPS
jgi:hypothetical protein